MKKTIAKAQCWSLKASQKHPKSQQTRDSCCPQCAFVGLLGRSAGAQETHRFKLAGDKYLTSPNIYAWYHYVNISRWNTQDGVKSILVELGEATKNQRETLHLISWYCVLYRDSKIGDFKTPMTKQRVVNVLIIPYTTQPKTIFHCSFWNSGNTSGLPTRSQTRLEACPIGGNNLNGEWVLSRRWFMSRFPDLLWIICFKKYVQRNSKAILFILSFNQPIKFRFSCLLSLFFHHLSTPFFTSFKPHLLHCQGAYHSRYLFDTTSSIEVDPRSQNSTEMVRNDSYCWWLKSG